MCVMALMHCPCGGLELLHHGSQDKLEVPAGWLGPGGCSPGDEAEIILIHVLLVLGQVWKIIQGTGALLPSITSCLQSVPPESI